MKINNILLVLGALLYIQCENKSEWTYVEQKFPGTDLVAAKYWLRFGKKDSIMTTFDRNGRMVGQMHFKNDVQEGKSTFFFPDGQLKEEQYLHYGKREGLIVSYHPNGQKAMESEYQNDKLNGKFRKWTPEGNLLVEAFFVNDSIQSKN
jgi:antitoxin component YwqK of YwqJK toxin-antitoxin module